MNKSKEIKTREIYRPVYGPMFNELGNVARSFPECIQLPVLHPYNANLPLGMMIGGEGFTPNISEKQYYESTVLNYITSYDGIVNARASGYAEDVARIKTAAQGGVSSVWYSDFRIAGLPPTINPAAINTGAIMNNASTGAWALTNPSAGQGKYLLTVGVNVTALGYAMVMLVDLLWAGSNITCNVGTGAQAVNSGVLTRYTTGAGVMMTFCVTTQIGGTAGNLTISYKNQGNLATDSTGPVALTTGCVVNRLQPVQGSSPFMILQAGDYGVYQIISATVSALMGGGVMDAYLFKPLAIIPTIVANTYIERDSTVQVDGLTQLIYGTDNALGCLGFFGLTSSATTCLMNSMIRTCAG